MLIPTSSFFPARKDLIRLSEDRGAPAFYLADCRLSADERLFRGEAERAHPVNTGALLLSKNSIGRWRFADSWSFRGRRIFSRIKR